MGGIGFYTRDNSNVFHFPGTLYRYNREIITELRTKNIDEHYSVGIHFPFGSRKAMGAYLNSPLPADFSVALDNVGTEFVTLERGTNLFYGWSGGATDYGVGLSIALDSYSGEDAGGSLDETARFFGLRGGLSNSTTDAAVTVDIPGIKREVGDSEASVGGFGFGGNFRMFHEKSPTMRVVPLVTAYYGSFSYEFDYGVEGIEKDETDIGLLELGLGAGLNYYLNDNNLVVLAVELLGLSQLTEDEKGGDEETERHLIMPGFYMGIESSIRPWLVGRIGAAQTYRSVLYKVEPDQGESVEQTTRESAFEMSFGLGMEFGDFSLDASLNEGIFFEGPNFISGADEPVAYKLSVTYHFGGSSARAAKPAPAPSTIEAQP
jgi:hypothetical protein